MGTYAALSSTESERTRTRDTALPRITHASHASRLLGRLRDGAVPTPVPRLVRCQDGTVAPLPEPLLILKRQQKRASCAPHADARTDRRPDGHRPLVLGCLAGRSCASRSVSFAWHPFRFVSLDGGGGLGFGECLLAGVDALLQGEGPHSLKSQAVHTLDSAILLPAVLSAFPLPSSSSWSSRPGCFCRARWAGSGRPLQQARLDVVWAPTGTPTRGGATVAMVEEGKGGSETGQLRRLSP
ncbi:hypothetical protein BS50DRAFT_123304 [Corynespora cassiicola Philippines]|uniref:Uncharacterized protein n=1 Tax=Corynespora cassiicola Philippines TaxID=1448308 RepID=A0A2T2NAY9_CORCC|nr:hypothetical protein BS50DRAFT_123304 [Corynespora cassiicola Philippines]